MFNKLSDFSYRRTKTQALGFYLAYLLLGMVVAGLSSGLLASVFLIDQSQAFEFGLQVGQVVIIFYTLALGGLLMRQKKLITFSSVLLVLVAGVLSIVGGGLLGLIPLAVLTTLSKKKV